MLGEEDKDKLSEEESEKIIESISRLKNNIDKDRVDIVNCIQVGSTFLLTVIVDNYAADKYAAQLIVYKEKEPDVNIIIENNKITVLQAEKVAQTIEKELFSLFSDQINQQKHRYDVEDYLVEVKDCNQLLQKINKMLNEKSELQAEIIKKLEVELKEEDAKAIQEIKKIRDDLAKMEKELEEAKEDLKSKQKKIEEMEKQMEEIKQEGTENPDINNQLKKIRENLKNSYKKLEDYEKNLTNPVLRKVKPPVMIVNKTLNKYTMHTLSLGTAINYVGGVVSTSGYGVIGGCITLAGSAIDTITSKIEELDEKGHEALITLEETCQRLRKIYKTLVEQKRLEVERLEISDFSDFSELVNKLQNNIIKGAELDIIDQIEKLKYKTKAIDKELKELIKTQQEQSTESISQEEQSTKSISQQEQSTKTISSSSRELEDINRLRLETGTSYNPLNQLNSILSHLY
ncbi:20441_t:CDS:1 [Dentiscutata erythropus]|uniref:20441_t:CDS:1 n=1 Tax=Dentiscutata erythropus TaxID=1348616 RepID=A0A9N9A7W0_9GLOM|nr:20441_t:CDS:1 [Dentiscutata erythropus]